MNIDVRCRLEVLLAADAQSTWSISVRYLHFLVATIFGGLTFSVLFMLLVALADGNLSLIALALPMAVFGFLMFGFVGSLLWYFAYSFLASRFTSSFLTCLSTAIVCSLLSFVPLSLLANLNHPNVFYQVVKDVGSASILCIPTATISSIFLWRFFGRVNQSSTRP